MTIIWWRSWNTIATCSTVLSYSRFVITSSCWFLVSTSSSLSIHCSSVDASFSSPTGLFTLSTSDNKSGSLANLELAGEAAFQHYHCHRHQIVFLNLVLQLFFILLCISKHCYHQVLLHQQHPHHFSFTDWWVPVLIFPFLALLLMLLFLPLQICLHLSTSDIQQVRLASWNNSRWSSYISNIFNNSFTIVLYHQHFTFVRLNFIVIIINFIKSFKLVFIFLINLHPLTLCCSSSTFMYTCASLNFIVIIINLLNLCLSHHIFLINLYPLTLC